MAKETHKTPEKPKAKPEPEKQDAAAAPPKLRHQLVGAAPTAAERPPGPRPMPMPRPIFGRRGDQQVPGDAQAVINALQQTVRSQAVLLRNYQELLRLEGQAAEGEEEAGEAA